MNFETMPELQWQYGHPMALVLMALVSVVLYVEVDLRKWI